MARRTEFEKRIWKILYKRLPDCSVDLKKFKNLPLLVNNATVEIVKAGIANGKLQEISEGQRDVFATRPHLVGFVELRQYTKEITRHAVNSAEEDRSTSDEGILHELKQIIDGNIVENILENFETQIDQVMGHGVNLRIFVEHLLRSHEGNSYNSSYRHGGDATELAKALTYYGEHHFFDGELRKILSSNQIKRLVETRRQSAEMVTLAFNTKRTRGESEEARDAAKLARSAEQEAHDIAKEMVRLYHVFAEYDAVPTTHGTQIAISLATRGLWTNHPECKELGSSSFHGIQYFLRKDGQGMLSWHEVDDPETKHPFNHPLTSDKSQQEYLDQLRV